MKGRALVVLLVSLGMIAGTGLYLRKLHERMRLGEPGVKVGSGALRDETGVVFTNRCVPLPDVAGFQSTNLPIDRTEINALPADTTYGSKYYVRSNDLSVQLNVVLMGTDRTSIHQPQYCLEAQSWRIEKEERIDLPVSSPAPYTIPALKLTTSHVFQEKGKAPVRKSGIYVYWFVSADHLTANQASRMFSLAQNMVEKGVLEVMGLFAGHFLASCRWAVFADQPMLSVTYGSGGPPPPLPRMPSVSHRVGSMAQKIRTAYPAKPPRL